MTSEMQTGSEWAPNWAIHPGELLEEHLETRGWTQAEFARRAGLTPKLVSTIISGKNPVSHDTAIALERVLGLRDYIWTGIQDRWDLHESRASAQEAASSPEVRQWLAQFPLKELQERGVVAKSRDLAVIFHGLLKFFQVGSIEGYSARFDNLAVQYRHSVAHKSQPACLAAWLQLGEIEASKLRLQSYDAGRFRQGLAQIRTLTTGNVEVFYPQMVETCANAGVALVAVPPLPKTRLSGAARWLGSGHAVIQLSLRHKMNDHFWFSFFHEAGHIMLHRQDTIFADDDGGEDGPIEKEADSFAEDMLVGTARLQTLCAQKPVSTAMVRQFADEIEIHPGIVVGMLQHHGCLPWSRLNELKDRFEWKD